MKLSSHSAAAGFDLFAAQKLGGDAVEKAFKTGTLAIVHPGGKVSKGPDGMGFANGCVITPDGKTLIIAESFSRHLSAFDIGEDGMLSNRRGWAETPGTVPDGICLCEDGSVWVGGSHLSCYPISSAKCLHFLLPLDHVFFRNFAF